MPRVSIEEHFWSKVNKTETCWLWTGGKTSTGYGAFNIAGKAVKAHRFAYETLVGSIPEDKEPDHLCRIPLCVRPDHLELVTHRENLLRGETLAALHAKRTHCPQGHSYDLFNTHWDSRGNRHCRACGRLAYRARYAKKEIKEGLSGI